MILQAGWEKGGGGRNSGREGGEEEEHLFKILWRNVGITHRTGSGHFLNPFYQCHAFVQHFGVPHRLVAACTLQRTAMFLGYYCHQHGFSHWLLTKRENQCLLCHLRTKQGHLSEQTKSHTVLSWGHDRAGTSSKGPTTAHLTGPMDTQMPTFYIWRQKISGTCTRDHFKLTKEDTLEFYLLSLGQKQ